MVQNVDDVRLEDQSLPVERVRNRYSANGRTSGHNRSRDNSRQKCTKTVHCCQPDGRFVLAIRNVSVSVPSSDYTE